MTLDSENIVTWNGTNWFTVFLMVAIPWLVIGLVAALVWGKTARLGGSKDHRTQ